MLPTRSRRRWRPGDRGRLTRDTRGTRRRRRRPVRPNALARDEPRARRAGRLLASGEPDETMAAVSPASPTMNGESLWPRLGGLPLVVEACEYDRLHAVLAYEFERITTHVRLVGAGADGLGEDVSVFREDGTALHETRPSLPLEGEWKLAGFCDHLATLELWPEPPEWDVALRLRNWAFESAALDLALRQAGRSLHEVLGLEPQPVRFVYSLGLGEEPSIEPVRRRLARSPGGALQARRRGDLGAGARRRGRGDRRGRHDRLQGPVRLRGQGSGDAGCAVRPRARRVPGRLPGGPTRPVRDRAAARRSSRARVLRLADPQRRGHRRDAVGRARGERQAVADRWPAPAVRGLRALRAGAATDVRRWHWALGVGRGQIELLAALFHADAPNDVAPSAYNEDDPPDGLPASPLAPRPEATGFRWAA